MEYDIRAYGASKRGRSHEITGKPCQDSSHFGLHPLFSNVAILIVADGVGSAERSEEGSRLAVDTVRAFLESSKPPFTPEMIREAYQKAWEAIDKHTEEGTGWPCDYDTTLSTAVFDAESGKIVYGHSGDGAILAIGLDGIVRSLTVPQKGAEANSVKPLRDLFAWEFGEEEGPFVSVMAMTDGVLDLLMPGRLKLTDEHIYIRLVSWLADYKFFEKKGTPIEDSFAKRLSYLQSDIHSGITNDDLTFVAAMNIRVTSEYRGDDYYKEPDWSALNELWKRKAYPSLYGDTTKEPDNPIGGPKETVSERTVVEESPDADIVKESESVVTKESSAEESVSASVVVSSLMSLVHYCLRNGWFNHAAKSLKSAVNGGVDEARFYLDSATLGDLSDPNELLRCKLLAHMKDSIAQAKLSEYQASISDQDGATSSDTISSGIKEASDKLDSMSVAGRLR